ncbi:hypothetical protein QTL86_06515 [Cellulosilyticum sp. ST5]|uniref:hypothetical protein n=1 Tax=Cellulosilyticum sp. ST5 TaxID=3055805 RepID=UPI003977453E
MSSKYYYGQDGMIVSEELIMLFDLGTKEMRYSSTLRKNVFDIVGFIFREEKILVVFPKNYYEEAQINSLNSTHLEQHKDIRLLFNVIQKYREREKTNASARSHIGSQDGYDSDYPFKAFYEVYDYYQRYGLYKEKEEKVVQGTKGRISWKDTIVKSNKVISGGNLIFTPFYVKKKNFNSVFLTECMVFIIDYTIDQFQDFLTLKKTGVRCKFDYLNNIDYVLQQLKTSSNSVFKDVNKRLIESMIEFFEQYRGKARGGNLHIKVRYFDMIWQKMIASFINKHFSGIDSVTGAAIFDMSIQHSVMTFQDKTFNDIDDSPHHFSIDIDHLAYESGTLFIFDSKYYVDIKELNYKQLSYNELLRYHYPGMTEMYNILILPGMNSSKIHFSFAAGYKGPRIVGTKIIEQYVRPQIVMEDYIA